MGPLRNVAQRFYGEFVAGNNETNLGLHVKRPIFLSDIYQICAFLIDCKKSVQNQIARKSVQRDPM